MKEIILLFLFFFVKNQVPSNYSINSCGNLGYLIPNKSADCIEPGEYCCFVHLKKGSDEKKFCASAPNKITKSEIENDIKTYTEYELSELECNNANFIKNIFGILFLLFFILF